MWCRWPVAAGVEADASTGQILPPVMGAAAFVMAEYIGVRYIDVIVAAAIPAFLYFATSYYMVHYRSLKEGLVGLPKEELPKLKDVLKNGFYFFLPLVLLIVFLVYGFSPSRAVFYAIVATIVLSWLKKETRLGPDADITPPVGLAAYAAAGLARANPLETGIEAFKMGITAYIVPFCFLYGPALLLKAPLPEIILAVITAIIACIGLGVAMQGWFLRKTPYWQRIMMFVGSVMLMQVGFNWDILGLAILALVWLMQYRSSRAKTEPINVSL